MISFPGELWVLLAGILLAVVRLRLTGQRRRWRTVAKLTRQRGWRATRRDREGLCVRYGQLELMRHGYNHRVRDVIIANERRAARAFCYHYETGFGKRHASRDLTVAVAETGAHRPGVWIGLARGVEQAGIFGRYRPIELDRQSAAASAGAARALSVYAESAHWVRTHLRPDIGAIPWGGRGPRTCEIRGPWVALYEEGIGSPQCQTELLARAQAVADWIEGTPTATAEDAEPPGQGHGLNPQAGPEGSGAK